MGRHLSANRTAIPNGAHCSAHTQLQNGPGVISDAGDSSFWRCENFLKFLLQSARAAVTTYYKLVI